MGYHYTTKNENMVRIIERTPHGIMIEFNNDCSLTKKFNSASEAALAASKHESGCNKWDKHDESCPSDLKEWTKGEGLRKI